jgi:predicted dehydrogenase
LLKSQYESVYLLIVATEQQYCRFVKKIEMKRLKWGIIGSGKIANKFASDFKYSEFGELAGVASTSIKRAEEFAKSHCINKFYGDYNKIFDDSSIDAIYIATPNHLHYQNSVDAIKSGKAVLCEKPLTINSDKTKALTDFSRNESIYLMEGMWTWFLPAISKAKEWVSKGRIGNIVQLKADFGFKADYDPKSRLFAPELGGGSMLDIGIYPIAFFWNFLRKDFLKLSSNIEYTPTGVDYHVIANLIYDKEVAQIGSSFKVNLPNWAYIIGDEGYIGLPNFWMTDKCYLYQKDTIIEEFNDSRQSFGFNYEIDAVSKDIIEGKIESDTYTHNDSIKVAEQIEKVLNS